MDTKKFIQGYFLIDKAEVTEEYEQMLNRIKKEYLICWDLVGEINNRQLYYAVLRDEKKLYDSIDEQSNTTIPGLISLFSERNLDIIGIWKQSGLFLGTHEKVVTESVINEDTGEVIEPEIIEIIGEPLYPFQKEKYMPYMNDIVTLDEEGNEISRTRPTTPKPIRLISGLEPQQM